MQDWENDAELCKTVPSRLPEVLALTNSCQHSLMIWRGVHEAGFLSEKILHVESLFCPCSNKGQHPDNVLSSNTN